MIDCTITDARPIVATITGDAMSCSSPGLITIVRGESATLDFYFTTTDADGEEAALDLTGATIYFRVKKLAGDVGDGVKIAKFSPGDGVVIETQTGDTLGHATLSLVPADTDGDPPMTPGVYVYEVRIVEASGYTRAANRGQFRLEGEAVNL